MLAWCFRSVSAPPLLTAAGTAWSGTNGNKTMPRNVSQSLRQNSEPSRRFTLLVNSAEPSTQEFSADGVTKASGLEVLLARLDIDPALTAAMGDGTNDIEMLM